MEIEIRFTREGDNATLEASLGGLNVLTATVATNEATFTAEVKSVIPATEPMTANSKIIAAVKKSLNHGSAIRALAAIGVK